MNIQKLLDAAYNYYVTSTPIMSDAEYDKLFKEVKKFEEANVPIENRITNKVCLGYFEGKETQKAPHEIPMLSIEKDNDRDITEESVCTPKFDGMAIEVNYHYGVLTSVLSRGNGKLGSDLTKYQINDIPTYVKEFEDEAITVVRGEAVADTWSGKTHRNYVAGLLGTKDINSIKERNIRMIAYFLYPFSDSYTEDFKILERAGFTVAPYKIVYSNKDFTKEYDGIIPIDGFVIRRNNNEGFGEHTSHHYKNMWAWKPVDEVAPTILKSVEWSQSKNGVWTPVGILEPVEIDGTTISRVNLASIDYIEEKDVAIGDSIHVRKAKQVIPELAEVVERPDTRIPIILEVCPNCGSDLVKQGIYLRCMDNDCSIAKRISFFCTTIKIKGLQEKSIEKLGLTHIPDIYRLTIQDLTKVLGKVGETIYKSIQDSKAVPLITLISALNPPMIKENTLEKIVPHIKTVEDLMNMNKLVNIKGIGEKKASLLSSWMVNNISLIYEFKELGFTLSFDSPNIGRNFEHEIAVSGIIPTLTREDVRNLLEPKGIKVKDDVTKSCKLLVIGDKPSKSKLDKATKYGIPIVTHNVFFKDLI